MTPKERILTAQTFFDVAVRLGNSVREGSVTPHMLKKPINIITGGPGLQLGPKEYTPQQLMEVMENFVFTAMGITAMAADQALDEALGAKNPDDVSQTGSLRAIIYMLRCAFAHDIAEVTWCCASKYQREYSVLLPHAGLIKFNGATVNGQYVMPQHIGGLEAYVEMLDLALRMV